MKGFEVMKILTSRNGVALVAVLTVLLVLTLLLPVMFQTSENATYNSVNELNRQKANYLARTGTEMAVATLKATLSEASFEPFYEALKDKTKAENSSYGIKLNSDENLEAKLSPISLYQKKDASGNVVDSKYISGTPSEADIAGYNLVGTTEITIAYNGDPEYYYVDEETGVYEKVSRSDAYGTETIYTSDEAREPIEVEEILEGYVAIFNDNFLVTSVATVKGQRATRTAVVIETVNMLNDEDPNDSFVAHTGQNWAEAPEFIRKIEGDYPQPYEWEGDKILGVIPDPNGNGKWVLNLDKDYGGMGGNQVMANPFKATSKKQIKAFGAGLNGVQLDSNKYYNKDVYIYSVIGNMNINLPNGEETLEVIDYGGNSGGNFTHYYALGAYPGLNWRIHESPNAPDTPALKSVNYASRVSSVQRYNFTSFCATDTLQVSLPVELRVNPKRTFRYGDGTDPSCTLFKVMNFQAKDIVFQKRVDLFASVCIEEFIYAGAGLKRTPSDLCYRGGFLNLTAPANTPYSYYNENRGEVVSAGIVYFAEPVYLWFQDTNALGAGTEDNSHNYGVLEFTNNTKYRTAIINERSKFDLIYGSDGAANAVYELDEPCDDLKIFKLFDAGDVYYFNAEAARENSEDGENLGVNLVNWYLETKYINAKEDSQTFWSYIFNFKQSLYYNYLENTLANNRTYVLDDMHYIGNMNENQTLTPPEVEDELYVVWDN